MYVSFSLHRLHCLPPRVGESCRNLSSVGLFQQHLGRWTNAVVYGGDFKRLCFLDPPPPPSISSEEWSWGITSSILNHLLCVFLQHISLSWLKNAYTQRNQPCRYVTTRTQKQDSEATLAHTTRLVIEGTSKLSYVIAHILGILHSSGSNQ
jgi:hypothetical protein